MRSGDIQSGWRAWFELFLPFGAAAQHRGPQPTGVAFPDGVADGLFDPAALDAGLALAAVRFDLSSARKRKRLRSLPAVPLGSRRAFLATIRHVEACTGSRVAIVAAAVASARDRRWYPVLYFADRRGRAFLTMSLETHGASRDVGPVSH